MITKSHDFLNVTFVQTDARLHTWDILEKIYGREARRYVGGSPPSFWHARTVSRNAMSYWLSWTALIWCVHANTHRRYESRWASRLQTWKRKNRWRVDRRHWCHWIGIYSLSQKIPIITHKKKKKKKNPSARKCIWRYRFKAGVWNSAHVLNQVVESPLFTSLWNRFQQWLSHIELIQMSAFSTCLFQH